MANDTYIHTSCDRDIRLGHDYLYVSSIVWNSTPDVIKNSNTVSVFGKNIKNWTGEGCNCNICK